MSTCCVATTYAPAEPAVARPENRPALDVRETGDSFRIDVDVPGCGKEDVEVGVEKGTLSIRARVPARAEAPERYHVREHGSRELVRSLKLGDTIDAAGITAEVTGGVLTILLPKVAAAKPRRIEVR
jgi:HSP20 family molecular chaperone IbpA